MSIGEICEAAKRFTREERCELFSALIRDLGTSEYDVSDEEVAKRLKETENGLVAEMSHEELVAGLKYLPKS